MEVWLKDEKNSILFRFPVIPMPLGVDGGASVDTVSIVKKGKVAIYNGIEPKTIKLDSFFPKHIYSACNYKDFPPPYECVGIIEKWRDEGALLRYIVTDTPINLPVIITHFNHERVDGTGNVHYSLTLMEKLSIKIPEWTPPATSNKKQIVTNKVYSSNRPNVAWKNITIHTVKHGEYLYAIAKRYYGDGSKYKKITSNTENLKKYPQLKNSNLIYTGWKLVIP